MYLEKNATIEFKYKKATVNDVFVNGEFKFMVNNNKILADHDYEETDWKVYKYDTVEGPGKYSFAWIYSKFNKESVDLSAEIEYISLYQKDSAALECLPCKRG